MLGHRFPDEPTTPQTWNALAWITIVLLIGLGTFGLYFVLQAPLEKADLASQLRNYSLTCYGLAAGVYAVKRFVGLVIG